MTAKTRCHRAAIIVSVSLSCFLFAGDADAQDRAIFNNAKSPHSRLRCVDLDDVKWTDGFWADKFTLAKDVTIPKMR